MMKKKFYSDSDIEVAKLALAELPDLTDERKSLKDFLGAIRDNILLLVRKKGYTIKDIRNTLKEAGYEVGEKALREIIREGETKKNGRRVTRRLENKTAVIESDKNT